MSTHNPYNPNKIEPKWQQTWEEMELFRAIDYSNQPKFYCLNFFPYPSGEGLHVGHCRNYIPTDVFSRYMRMRGYNVLHPMGWDAFGEPAEQHAIAHGIHPRISTDRNSANYKRQLRLIGNGYDWSREIDSSVPEYYRWTQWFFLLLYRRGLAYRDTNWQWWCPTCATTLSSQEIIGDKCWRGHSGVTKREIPAWYFRITAYADELITGLDEVNWPESIKTMQRNWIGRSEGCEIDFRTEDGEPVSVFTTRPDTLFGVTFFVFAPEHALVSHLTTDNRRSEVESYVDQAIRQSEIERTSESREKTGVFTGGYVINPLSGDRVPAWIADYVLPSYGTGVVMGVPAHDQRDYEFAQKYELPIKVVVSPPDYGGKPLESAYRGIGTMINSGVFDGLANEEGVELICDHLEENGIGRRKVNYRMRDWLISRQRYWGAPIPILYCDECGEVPVPEDQLPVLLPPLDDFEPDGTGRPPLARIPDFLHTDCPVCGGRALREADTMGGFACSSWYFLRFASPSYQEGPFEKAAMNYWLPVDLYVGGAEHAVLHLLYARFWTKVMADAGLVPFREPFMTLLNQGMLHGPDGKRMSKSRGNVITPDEMVAAYGADSLRMYSMFIAPFDHDVDWTDEGIHGARRFLNRIWNLFQSTYLEIASTSEKDLELERLLHKTIHDVTERMEDLRFNTMISVLMGFVNILVERYQDDKWRTATYRQALETLLVLIAPAAPHIAEEMWGHTGKGDSVHLQPWPEWDDELAREEVVALPVQVNGRVRDVIEIPIDWDEEKVQKRVFDSESVQRHIGDQKIDMVVYVPGKILNVVTMNNENE